MKHVLFSGLLFVIIISLCGCIGRQAYYVSPVYGLNPGYQTVPLNADSIKAATYANAALSFGTANEDGHDKKFSFNSSLSRSHNFGKFGAHYGAGLLLGSYRVARYDSIGNNRTVNYKAINQRVGNYGFGALNINSGIHLAFGDTKGELRFPGFEVSLSKEFGNYADFRNDLPDSAATIINRSTFFGTAGIYVEGLSKWKDGSVIGLKMGYGKSLGKGYSRTHIPDAFFGKEDGFSFNYSYVNLNFSWQRYTLYAQLNRLRKSDNNFIGFNYRLGK